MMLIKATVTALTCAALAGLAGCGGVGVSGSSVSQSVGNVSSANAAQVQQAFVQSGMTVYNPDGSIRQVNEYELDDRGNRLIEKMTTYNNGEVEYKRTVSSTYAEEGYRSESKEKGESHGVPYEFSYEYDVHVDDDGRVSEESVTRDGAENSVYEYSYYSSGQVKRRSQQYAMGTSWVTEIDKRGCPESYVVDHATGPSFSYKYEWSFDSSDRPTSVRVEKTVSESGKDDVVTTANCSVDLDEWGNVVAVRDESGKLIAEYTYQRIDNPSPYALSQAGYPVVQFD